MSKEVYTKRDDRDYSAEAPMQRETYTWAFTGNPVSAHLETFVINGTSYVHIENFTSHKVMLRTAIQREGRYFVTSSYNFDAFDNVELRLEYSSATEPHCFADVQGECEVDHLPAQRRQSLSKYDQKLSRWLLQLPVEQLLSDICIWHDDDAGPPDYCEPGGAGLITGTVRDYHPSGDVRMARNYHRNDQTVFAYHPTGELHTKTDPLGKTVEYNDYRFGLPQREEHPEETLVTRVVDEKRSGR